MQYKKILKDFGYSRRKDKQAAFLLDSILRKPFPTSRLKKLISGKTVFVIGAGPSLRNSIKIIKKHKETLKIAADSTLGLLVKNGIIPEIIVTDLDGDLQLLSRLGKKCIMIVHAHGDNIDRLDVAKNFKRCVGTTQTEEVGRIYNFGGFTDGDRCVFLASQFGAKKIVMFGMDFGPRIGLYSGTKKQDRKVKLKKLRYGKKLLEWLATKTNSQLFTISKPPKGVTRITPHQIKHVLSQNAFNTVNA